MKLEIKEKQLVKGLLKPYGKKAMKIRRRLFNFYRPISHDRSESIFNQHLMFYIMFSLFILSGIFLGLELSYYPIPFLSGWVFVLLTAIYFRFFPQTWAEMYDYEKAAFRKIYKKRKNWRPKLK
jgi:hypothetical protein